MTRFVKDWINTTSILILMGAFFTPLPAQSPPGPDGWEPLFNGKDLSRLGNLGYRKMVGG